MLLGLPAGLLAALIMGRPGCWRTVVRALRSYSSSWASRLPDGACIRLISSGEIS